jgi:hypothetical protein
MCMFIVVLSPFIGFVLYHDLMNYLLYICMPICCMTLVNKDNNKQKIVDMIGDANSYLRLPEYTTFTWKEYRLTYEIKHTIVL